MIIDLLPKLNKLRLVLASQSPRRLEILRGVGLKCHVVPSTFEETVGLEHGKFAQPADYAVEVARQKALDVWGKLAPTATPPDLVIASDTIVVHGKQILEKPKSAAEAVEMLTTMSASSHYVCSGVALIVRRHGVASDPKVVTFFEKTEVTFASLSKSTIDAYVASGEPMDKAGGYGIQGVGGSFVSQLRGCYYTVVGFPLHRFCSTVRTLMEAGELGEGPGSADTGADTGSGSAAGTAGTAAGAGAGGGAGVAETETAVAAN